MPAIKVNGFLDASFTGNPDISRLVCRSRMAGELGASGKTV